MATPKNDAPLVSVVIPAYESHGTLAACLKSLKAQTLNNFQVILVDSSPSTPSEIIVREQFDWVEYEHVGHRMLPHEARNYGMTKAAGELIVFTDPDIYAEPNWLGKLIQGYRKHGGIIVGSVSCFGNHWLDQGIHLAKFDEWLPGGVGRETEIAPTLNMLCPREIFNTLGGFPGEYVIGDTVFSWHAAQMGIPIHFVPEAEVVHHHKSTWAAFLNERFHRGREFGQIRISRNEWSRWRIARHLLVTLLPLRLSRLLWRTFKRSVQSSHAVTSALTWPIIVSGHSAWLLGEARAFISVLFHAG
jgi:GT2 family glycosyltransferase